MRDNSPVNTPQSLYFKPKYPNDFTMKIKAADALLIATPEYNYSIPGVLKNAIDAASRPYADKVFDGKPVAVMSASTGRFGGARAPVPPAPVICVS